MFLYQRRTLNRFRNIGFWGITGVKRLPNLLQLKPLSGESRLKLHSFSFTKQDFIHFFYFYFLNWLIDFVDETDASYLHTWFPARFTINHCFPENTVCVYLLDDTFINRFFTYLYNICILSLSFQRTFSDINCSLL